MLQGELVEWRAADSREGPPLSKGEWYVDYEWFFEASPMEGEVTGEGARGAVVDLGVWHPCLM
jgi:hypothetical protein